MMVAITGSFIVEFNQFILNNKESTYEGQLNKTVQGLQDNLIPPSIKEHSSI
jgi:hypothetical protein